MISPENRSLLSDALTPPPGYFFDCGMATTYSLDLVTLLTMPLHMAWLATGDDSSNKIDLVRALEALRRTAGRFTVFCERGRLQIPRQSSPLLLLLENMVHEVVAPHSGAFHPKVWLLRFIPEDGARQAVLRLLVMSRNLTDDDSWDLSVCLEGRVGQKTEAGGNLARFINRVSRLSRKTLSAQRRYDLDILIKEAGRVAWDLPGHFEQVQFHALGLDRKKKQWIPKLPMQQWDELGVISPFVKAGALQELAKSCKSLPYIISRADELDQLPSAPLKAFGSLWILAEGVDQPESRVSTVERMTGLHAKAYIGRAAWVTHLYIGSANATDAALLYGNNVEFMVELIGRHSRVGKPIAWIEDEGLASILTPYQRSVEQESDEEDQTDKDEQELEKVRQFILQQDLVLECVRQESVWEMHLRGLALPMRENLKIAIWPLTLRSEQAVLIPVGVAEPVVVITGLMKHQLTSFMGFCLTLNQAEVSMGLEIPLTNPPEDRESEVLRTVLVNREGFVRYLMLILGDMGPAPGTLLQDGSGSRHDWLGSGAGSEALFEMLSRAYASDPDKLDQISDMIIRLQGHNASGEPDIVPQEFQELWSVIKAALAEDKK